MATEVGAPVVLGLLFEVNPLVVVISGAAAVLHEATAAWDVRVATSVERPATGLQGSGPGPTSIHGVAAGACQDDHWTSMPPCWPGPTGRVSRCRLAVPGFGDGR